MSESKLVVELGRHCPGGKIWRKGYTTRKGVHVPGTCVQDTGKPGKTPARARKLPKPKPGTLHGWKAVLPATERRKALRKATQAEGCRSVISRINLERGYTKRTSPDTYRKLVSDWKWLRNQPFCELKTV